MVWCKVPCISTPSKPACIALFDAAAYSATVCLISSTVNGLGGASAYSDPSSAFPEIGMLLDETV